jgi:hypothetical protein
MFSNVYKEMQKVKKNDIARRNTVDAQINSNRERIGARDVFPIEETEMQIADFYLKVHEHYKKHHPAFNEQLVAIANEALYIDSFTALKIAVKCLLDCITYVNQHLSDFDVNNYTKFADIIANYFDVITQAKKYIPWPQDSLLKTSVLEYISYLQENFDDFGWVMMNGQVMSFKENETSEAATEQGSKSLKDQGLKKFFSLFENLPNKHSPFKSSILKTLTEFDKFTQSISNPERVTANMEIECLLPALKDDDLATIKNIVTADPGCIGRTYPLNRTMDEIGFTPLMYAAKHCRKASSITEGLLGGIKGKKEILAYLTNKITDPNSLIVNYNVLMIAAKHGDSKIFAALLNYVATSKAFLNNAMIEKILKALCSSYLGTEDGDKCFNQLLTIFGVSDGDTPDDSEITNFFATVSGSIFSQNTNLFQKIVAFHYVIRDLKPLTDPMHFRYGNMNFLNSITYGKLLNDARSGLDEADMKEAEKKDAQGPSQRRKLN